MRFFAVALSLCLLAVPAAARTQFNAADQADLDKVSAYLNSIRTMKAGFIQTGPDGDDVQGKLYLVKPGRIRFEYDPPAPLLVVSDGRTVAVQNKELKTVDRYPISQTPLDIILGDTIDLKKNSEIVAVQHLQDQLIVKAHTSNFGVHADIALIFAMPSLELRQWTVVDDQGMPTQVVLRDVQTGIDVPPAEFVLPRPSVLGFH